MKRKTFVKQLMALGLQRNKANSLCREAHDRASKYRESELSARIAWEAILAEVLDQLDDTLIYTQNIVWLSGAGAKYIQYVTKRSKEDPRRSWDRNHPNDM